MRKFKGIIWGVVLVVVGVIKANAIFGGIDIYVPEGVNVKVNSTSFFGGVENKIHKNSPGNQHTIYIHANCLFGGIDIK